MRNRMYNKIRTRLSLAHDFMYCIGPSVRPRIAVASNRSAGSGDGADLGLIDECSGVNPADRLRISDYEFPCEKD